MEKNESRLRSQEALSRPENSMQRALFKSMGFTDEDLDKPQIGIANSWNNIVSGSFNLRDISEEVKKGIIQAGGNPLEFGVISACDGIAQSNEGMHYILPTREIIVHSIELMVQAHRLDGIVMLGSCDKIVPGMLMAAARLELPSIILPGGPMEGGEVFDGRKSDTTTITEALGMLQKGEISYEEYIELEDKVAPTCGSCSFLGTANTMCALAEAMGMTVPGAGTAPATSAKRRKLAKLTGIKAVELIKNGVSAEDIINKNSLENAIKVNIAIGGSTNAILHLIAVAQEAELDISIKQFDEYSQIIPYIAKIYPSSKENNVIDFDRAGGVQAVLKELADYIELSAPTVNGSSIEDNINDAENRDKKVIADIQSPFGSEGGVAILEGNIAPDTGVAKPSAIPSDMFKFKGEARVFDSEEEANEAIINKEIDAGDVVVIRYEGPKGGPGMREMYKPLKLLYGEGLALETALITDGRFSGTNNGCFVGHISPEAIEGGPIAVVEDGDEITIDIENRSLKLHVSEEEIEKRFAGWDPPQKDIPKGYLNIYSKLAKSADEGAVLSS